MFKKQSMRLLKSYRILCFKQYSKSVIPICSCKYSKLIFFKALIIDI